MKCRILILLILLSYGCTTPEEHIPIITNRMVALPHNSLGEYFNNIVIQFSFTPLNNEEVRSITWDFGDGTNNEIVNFGHIYKLPGEYIVKMNVTTSITTYSEIKTINIVESPQIYGTKEIAENAILAFTYNENDIAILYVSGTYGSYQYLSINEDSKIKPPIIINWPTYSNLSPYFITNSRKLAIMIDDDELSLFNPNTADVNSYYIRSNYFTDLKNLGSTDDILFFYDSLDYASIKTLNINSSEYSSMYYSTQVNEMNLVGVYAANEESFLCYYIDENREKELLINISYEGNILFTSYFEKENMTNLASITNLTSGGWIINSSEIGNKQKLTKISISGQKEWQRTIEINNKSYLNYIYGPNIKIIEFNDYIYVFYDNMRCTKISSTDGSIIWDHYYDLSNSIFHDAVSLNQNSFIMVGARQVDSVQRMQSNDYLQRDMVFIKINSEGNRIDF